ncbi:MAG: PadR family transcriptional regulator [Candidatus Omnitrophica bacterium]|nr:PadR family transcriptional regulator [Candidatus Omnitrophota bacterium]
MIEHEFLFLGLLKAGPKHGYEVKRIIEEELQPLLGLKIKSIYYPLKQMEKYGLISKETDRSGNFPEKYVYTLTAQGAKVFDRQVTESFLTVERPYFNIDLSLYFLQYVDKKTAQRKLRGRTLVLKRIRTELLKLSNAVSSSRKYLQIILTHDLDLVEAEINFISRLMKSLNNA